MKRLLIVDTGLAACVVKTFSCAFHKRMYKSADAEKKKNTTSLKKRRFFCQNT